MEISPKPKGCKGYAQGEYAQQMLQYFVSTCFFYENGIITDSNPEDFRKYRVNLRKARVILFIFKDIIKKKNYRSISEDFKMMMDKIGEIWELDVFRNRLSKFYTPEYVAINSNAFDYLRQILDRIREERNQMCMKGIISPEFQTQKRELWTLLSSGIFLKSNFKPRYKTLKPIAYSLINETYTDLLKITKKMVKSIQEASDKEIHQLRIKFKKLRYFVESFPDIVPPRIAKISAIFKSVQDSFGLFTDLTAYVGFINKLSQENLISTDRLIIFLEPIDELQGKIKYELKISLIKFIHQ